MLTAGLISAALAKRLPGAGAVYLAQRLEFRSPVRPGDTVTVTVTVASVDTAAARVVLSTVCHVKDRTVLDGEATLKTSRRSGRAAQHRHDPEKPHPT
jgi:3-hydroxybutyryl-CoA dehydratase